MISESVRKINSVYYQKNKDRLKECQKTWRKNNTEYSNEYQKKWSENNPDYIKNWQKNNPDKLLINIKKYLNKIGKSVNMDSLEYDNAIKVWSLSVKKRDNNTCQICDFKGNSRNIHAHHIFYKAKYPQLSLNMNNGISLCMECHGKLHGYEVYFR